MKLRYELEFYGVDRQTYGLYNATGFQVGMFVVRPDRISMHLCNDEFYTHDRDAESGLIAELNKLVSIGIGEEWEVS